MIVEVTQVRVCPDCGTALANDGDTQCLCPACLMELALETPTRRSEVLDPGKKPTIGYDDCASRKAERTKLRVLDDQA